MSYEGQWEGIFLPYLTKLKLFLCDSESIYLVPCPATNALFGLGQMSQLKLGLSC